MTGSTAAIHGDPPLAEALSALLARGVCRALDQLGYASLLEFPLANGRRADILALGRSGELCIVEIKSSVADFRADRKWSAYRDFADRFYFA
ncbi:MAG TPA: MmcB family DNA repair protein, partial [Stellaceae bacterium]|nr:MmcB family DNA repair protein [Stellaceae bacterium]